MIKKVYGRLELIVNICVLGKMRIAAFLAQLCCARVFFPMSLQTYRSYPVTFEPEHIVRHSAIWQTRMVHICAAWFKISRESAGQALVCSALAAGTLLDTNTIAHTRWPCEFSAIDAEVIELFASHILRSSGRYLPSSGGILAEKKQSS